jgi:transposase
MKEETMAGKRARRTYSEELKKQLVELLNHGKPRSEILREYDLTASAFDKWVKCINTTGSTRDKDNRTPEEQEMLRLRKENQQLRMENDVLKQAALIFARK